MDAHQLDTNSSSGDLRRRGDALFAYASDAQGQPLAQTMPLLGSLSSSGPTAPVIASGRTFDATGFIHSSGSSIKPGANVRSLDAHMAPAIIAVAQESRALGLTAPTVTSAQDRHHKRDSLHPDGRALDFRGKTIGITEGQLLAGRVSQRLGPDYDVQFETFPKNPDRNHLHTEYDPKPRGKPRRGK
jgi:conjugal transfer mating pair stabilization protein TraG